VVRPTRSNEFSDFSRVSIFFPPTPRTVSSKKESKEISTTCFSSDNRCRNLVNNSLNCPRNGSIG
jgi:hypothetical protein